ncbi:Agamous-like MADS-box protein AGL29 [Glycine soja]|uniref:Agamous-like MADS-box protein AGL29 n=1 Tax=Glycine soja TaxID=3848 RepID=A0A445FT14_GLYSO|nr:Agamous-like MADS-box protein AGL29 [Glycine soja]
MGRRKIQIAVVKDPNTRQVTFSKRRTGLFKKANELSILCGVEIAIVVFSIGNKPYSFGHPSVDVVVTKFLQHATNSNDALGSNNSSNEVVGDMERLNQQLSDLQTQILEEEIKGTKHDERLKQHEVTQVFQYKELQGLCLELQRKVKDYVDEIEVSEYSSSCCNCCSTRLVSKLSLAITPHPKPYKLQWLNEQGEMIVNQQVKVSFSIGTYKDEVICDVVPMEAGHLLFGRP